MATVCDPCAEAPAGLTACRATTTCSERSSEQCGWVERVDRTLALEWGTWNRGWGNSYSYIRTLHYAAALLGRRLLLHTAAYLPTGALLFGSRSWRLEAEDFDDYVAGAHVVSSSNVPSPASLNATTLLRHLQTLHAHTHIWINMTVSGRRSLGKLTAVQQGCAALPHSWSFINCIGRLLATPAPHIAAPIASLRVALPERYTVRSPA